MASQEGHVNVIRVLIDANARVNQQTTVLDVSIAKLAVFICSDRRCPHCHTVPYSGYFLGGKSFVSSEFLSSSWKNFHGRSILNHTSVLCGTVSLVKISWFTSQPRKPRKFPSPPLYGICISFLVGHGY